MSINVCFYKSFAFREIPLKTVTYIAPYAKVGPLFLSQELKEKFTDFEEVTSDERPDRRDIKLHLGIYYHCRVSISSYIISLSLLFIFQDVWNPEVGDIRVQFYYAGLTGEPVTVIAKQEKGMLVPYTTSKGKVMALLRNGNLNIAEMFSAEHWDAKLATWKLRFYGGVFIYFAVICWSRLLRIVCEYK